MAKMKIHEIAKSIQHMQADIKSSDIVRLLNENGFDVKGPNSNIEDDAIRFLLNHFQNRSVPAAKEEKKDQGKTASGNDNNAVKADNKPEVKAETKAAEQKNEDVKENIAVKEEKISQEELDERVAVLRRKRKRNKRSKRDKRYKRNKRRKGKPCRAEDFS